MKPAEGNKLSREREVLKTNECRKLLRGTGVQGKFGYGCGEAKRGKLTYETKWLQEVERHIAGKGKLILKPDVSARSC